MHSFKFSYFLDLFLFTVYEQRRDFVLTSFSICSAVFKNELFSVEMTTTGGHLKLIQKHQVVYLKVHVVFALRLETRTFSRAAEKMMVEMVIFFPGP